MNDHHVGEIIRARREGVYLSKRKLAAEADINVKTLRLIEHGAVNPRRSTVDLIDDVLNRHELRVAAKRKELGLKNADWR